jgi:hypothetical protein
MPEPYADTVATLAAGRIALVARLRTIANRLEALPLDDAAEVLVFLGPAVDALERKAALALEVRCEPARSQRGRTLTLPVGRRNRRPSASSRVPGGIAIADITRRQTAELLQKSFKILIT